MIGVRPRHGVVLQKSPYNRIFIHFCVTWYIICNPSEPTIMAKISNSNTKAEILAAYEQLLTKLTAEQKENATLTQQLEKKRQEVETVKQKLQSGATANIQSLRKALNEQLDKIEQGLEREQAIFKELQQAIATEKAMLEEVYQIKAEAQSLEALLITHRQASESFEAESAAWEANFKQEVDAKKLAWKREQDAYAYDLSTKRRKEEDIYQALKLEREKEWEEKLAAFEAERKQKEELIAEREEEYQQLKKQVASFDQQLQAAVRQAEKELQSQLTKEFDFKQQLETKDLQNKIQLLEANIKSLEAKVGEQKARIEALTHKADDASLQVKEIAFKAIEQSATKAQPIILDRSKEPRGEG